MTGTPRSIIGPHTILSFTNLPTNKHNDSKKYDFILIYFEATILTSGDFVRVLIIIPEGRVFGVPSGPRAEGRWLFHAYNLIFLPLLPINKSAPHRRTRATAVYVGYRVQ